MTVQEEQLNALRLIIHELTMLQHKFSKMSGYEFNILYDKIHFIRYSLHQLFINRRKYGACNIDVNWQKQHNI